MKKIAYLLIAAMSLVSVASCVKELTPEPALVAGEEHVFTVSLPAATRTALVEGKTVWAKGDSLWIYNGVASESIVVPEEAWGQKEFTFTAKTVYLTDTTKTLYVVYPYTAAAGVAEGKIKVNIPSQQDGEFASANIAAAVAENYTISLKNVTALLKVTVPETAKVPIYSLAFGAANGNPLTGTCTVDFSGSAPILTPVNATPSAAIQVDGLAKEFYLSVIPGTFDAGFRMTAATTDFQYASETKETTVANSLKANDLVDLGVIGLNLQPLDGEGTEANPWLIRSLGHLIAIASAVDEGNSFEDGYFKVANDISGINVSIGSSGETVHAFCGNLDGGDQVLTLDLNGVHNTGLFGVIGGKANIHNVKLAGTVNASGNSAAALAGQINASGEDPIVIKDVVNNASVKGARSVGGIVGYSTGGSALITIENCTNNGAITSASNRVGGIAGEMLATSCPKTIKNCTNNGQVVSKSHTAGGIVGYFANAVQNSSGSLPVEARVKNALTGCTNSGSVSSTTDNGNHYYRYKVDGQSSTYLYNYSVGSTDRGTGGIVGYSAQTDISECVNSGAVNAINKAGGIAGFICFSDIDNCQNSGNVSVTSLFTGSFRYEGLAGGIAGGTLASDHIRACENSGSIVGDACVGGIIGFAIGGNANGTTGKPATAMGNAPFVVDKCKNTGSVRAKQAEAGGIAGICYALNGNNKSYVSNCINEGEVVSEKTKAGGIVGVLIDDTGWGQPNATGCINNGSVTAQYWVGGIVGYGGAIARIHNPQGSNVGLVTHRFMVKNCQNNGTVLANRSDADNGEVAGGIMGACFFGSGARSEYFMGIEMYNCLNTGDVLYAEAAHKNVYCGGLIGNFGRGCVFNSASSGRVGPFAGEAAEGSDKYMGALFGRVDGTANRNTTLSGCYYLAGTANLPYGSGSVVNHPAPVDVISYSAEEYGLLSDPTSGGFFFVDEALNNYVSTHTGFFPWMYGDKLKLVFE